MDYLPSFSAGTWTLVVLLLSLLILYGYAPYRFFKKLGIHGPKPLPFIGTFLEYRKGLNAFDTECYKKYGKLWGFYDGRQPVLAVMDTDLIKTILVKECYSIFTNRQDFGLNGPLSDAISVVEDENWRRIRSVLSPSFTSGRLKEMYPIMLEHSARMLKVLHKKAEADEILEVKEIFGPYSMDVVTSTAFSIDIDSINHPSDPFVANIKKMVKFNFLSPLLIISVLFPLLRKIFIKLDLSFFPSDVLKFFYGFLQGVKADRHKKEHQKRVDFMQLMVDSQVTTTAAVKDSPTGLTDHEILSQAMIFIFAGYETSSTTMSFLAYNLALHPEIQRTLQREIDEALPDKARPTYEALMKMEYLDMVLNESQRLFPVVGRVDRVAKSTVQLNDITIPKGTVVVVPVYVLHHEPNLWPEPEAFKPERFSKENKDSINPYAYLPFGAGPRNCIGMRFAVLMMKLAMVEILQKFSFVTCKETEIPLELGIDGFTAPKNPIKLKLVPRLHEAA